MTLVKKTGLVTIVSYIVIVIMLYFIGGEQFRYKDLVQNMQTPQSIIGEIVDGMVIEQEIEVQGENLKGISLFTSNFKRDNTGKLIVQLVSEKDGEKLAEKEINISSILLDSKYDILFDNLISIKDDEKLKVIFQTKGCYSNNAITFWVNNDKSNNNCYINGEKQKNSICMEIVSNKSILFGEYYFYIMLAILMIICVYFARLIYFEKKGKKTLGINIIYSISKYRFLINQLVARDFKTKYKRSVLGVLWSFLNPLLTMMVQYIVFSTLFKSDIANFPVYLLTGIVLFNFFTESVGIGLTSIVGNASLITKVYVPKYIYPVTRVMSSTVNLLLATIPLIIVVILTKTPLKPSMILIVFGMICTVIFAIGMTLLLSSAMVFFQDTQFLWTVISMLWVYATPIFYPESIIPQKFMIIYKMNPMYHFIRFNRTAIISGVSPEPQAYLLCLIFAFGMLLIGGLVFKKCQNKFVLYI